jgi:hypothetical protein
MPAPSPAIIIRVAPEIGMPWYAEISQTCDIERVVFF